MVVEVLRTTVMERVTEETRWRGRKEEREGVKWIVVGKEGRSEEERAAGKERIASRSVSSKEGEVKA